MFKITYNSKIFKNTWYHMLSCYSEGGRMEGDKDCPENQNTESQFSLRTDVGQVLPLGT